MNTSWFSWKYNFRPGLGAGDELVLHEVTVNVANVAADERREWTDLEFDVGERARRTVKGVVVGSRAVVDRLAYAQLERAEEIAEARVRPDRVGLEVLVAGARPGERELPGTSVVYFRRRHTG
jgi:hypothetical protein